MYCENDPSMIFHFRSSKFGSNSTRLGLLFRVYYYTIFNKIIYPIIMQSPFDAIIQVLKERLQSEFENQRYNLEQLEKFVLWIVGFSTGTIALLISNASFFHLQHSFSKLLLFLLCISIGAGIIFRYSLFKYRAPLQRGQSFLWGAFQDIDVMSIDADDMSNETDIFKIVNSLSFDFGLDFSFVLKDYHQLTNELKDQVLLDLKTRHHQASLYAKESYRIAIAHLKESFSKAYGINEAEFNKALKSSNGETIRAFLKWINITFWISCCSFLLTLILLSIFG